MTPRIDDILSKLSNVKQNVKGSTALCPAHNDHERSLSIKEGNDGKVLLYCHAGCEYQDIMAALGESRPEYMLKPRRNGNRSRQIPSDPWACWVKKTGIPKEFWQQSLGVDYNAARGGFDFTFSRTDIVKVRPADGRKGWWDPSGAATPPLWPTPSESLPEHVIWAAGETDCATLRYTGYETFTGTKGEGTIPPAAAMRILKDRGVKRVTIIYDADDSGGSGAVKMSGVTISVGLEADIGQMPDDLILAGGKDVNDLWRWLECDRDAFRRQMDAILREAKPLDDDALHEEERISPQILMTADEIASAKSSDTWVKKYVRYALQRTDAPPEFHELTGFTMLSVAVGRKARLRLITGDVYPTLWGMLIANSTIDRKSTTVDLGEDILNRTGEDLLAPTDFTPQAFVQVMAERDGTATIFIRDEFSGFYEGLNKLEFQIGGKEILITFYDGRPYKRTLRKETFDIKEPFLSVLTATTRDKFLEVASESDILSGFLARFAICVRRSPRIRKDLGMISDHIEGQQTELIHDLQSIMKKSAGDMTASAEVFVRWNMYSTDLEEETLSSPNPGISGPINGRAAERALKAAMLLAFAEGRNIELHHLFCALLSVERWRHDVLELVQALAPSRFEKQVQKALHLVNTRPGIARGELMRALRLSSKEASDIELTLSERGEITVAESGRTKKGKNYYPTATERKFE